MFYELRRRARKTGQAPGTVMFTGERHLERSRITVTDFDPSTLVEREVERGRDCAAFKDSRTVTWIDVAGLHDVTLLEEMGAVFGIHPLVLEDIAHPGQRPKVEVYEDYLFIVARALEPAPDGGVLEEQVSLVLVQNCLITFQERSSPVLDVVRKRIQANRGRVRRMGVDYLAYALMDAIVDEYFVLLEDVGEALEELEERLMEEPGQECLEDLHELRKDVMSVRRAAWPLREMMTVLQREESPLVEPATLPFLRDLQDHAQHVVENVEEFRELLTSLMDIYLSSSSQRTNEVIRVLTIIASIFIPLTFIVGVYGMNFEHMPELTLRWGYLGVWVVMVVVTFVQVFFMWRKGWF